MSSKVVIRVIKGKLTVKEFIFDEHDICIIGRNPDCHIPIPDDEDHSKISRRHCLLEINPPQIRVRDYGSKNGTIVNGKKIGQRDQHETPEEAKNRPFPERDLKDGDTITLGKIVFQVSVENLTNDPISTQKTVRLVPRSQEPPDDYPEGSENNNIWDRDLISLFREMWEKKLRPLIEFPNDENSQTISRYELLKTLGEGGYGAVYLARNENCDEEVAIKVMLPQTVKENNQVERFLREIENTKALKHPNIVELFDYGYCYKENAFFFTLEYSPGGSLQQLIKQRGLLSIEESVNIILQVLDGLEYAHKAEIPYVRLANGRMGRGNGLVHRDIKPDNILLMNNQAPYQVKIADFGLSKSFELAGLSGLSVSNGTAGTPSFMCRKQVINFKYAKPDVDVWSTAATLYYLLTGQYVRKFTGEDSFIDILKNDTIPIRRQNSSIPEPLAKVIDGALNEESNNQNKINIQTARAFKTALLFAMGWDD